MELSPYIDRLHEDLKAAAEGAPADVQDAAGRLVRHLDARVRLMLIDVLADVAAEITSSLPSGHVSARLSGRAVEFDVTGVAATPPVPVLSSPAEALSIQDAPADGDLARITVRLPEAVKELAEQQAGRFGQSLNSWIVRTVRQATAGGVGPDPLSHSRFEQDFPSGQPGRGRMSGWV